MAGETVQIAATAGGALPTIVLVGQSIGLTATGSPGGGTFTWSIGGGHASLDTTTGDTVNVHGDNASMSADDVTVTVKYKTSTGSATDTVKLSVLRCVLDVDADRDGTIDKFHPGKASWTWGAGGAGAVVLANLDDGDKDGTPDADDTKVNGAGDVADLAPLFVHRCGPRPLPHGHQAVIVVTDASKLRIFKSRAVGATVAIDAATGAEHPIAFPDQEHTLGVEATQMPTPSFDGILDIALVIRDSAGTEVARDSVQMRVAPWMANASHLETADKLFVVDTGTAIGTPFLTGVRAFATALGLPLVEHSSGDQWMQDTMEIGCTSIPGSALHVVLNSPQPRPLHVFPPTLLGPGTSVVDPVTPMPAMSTFNSGGSYECTPPGVTRPADGKTFPFGRIYTGPGRVGEKNDMLPFFKAQVVQEPFTIDTTWLTVGHVDEVTSFVPNKAGGFKLVLASPDTAVSILNTAKAGGHGTATVMTGRTDDAGNSVETTVDAMLTDATLMAFQTTCQGKIDAIRQRFKDEIGITDADVVELPIIMFEEFPGLAGALTGGVVNMLVANKRCGICKPFGPVVAGKDLFEEDVKTKLTPLGLTVQFIDDWNLYHVKEGEVHCGTNTRRKDRSFPWWQFVP
jgi:protein-arginine deiminase